VPFRKKKVQRFRVGRDDYYILFPAAFTQGFGNKGRGTTTPEVVKF